MGSPALTSYKSAESSRITLHAPSPPRQIPHTTPGIDVFDLEKAFQQQPCSRQEHRRQRDFRDHENAPQAACPRPGGRVL